MNEQQLQTQLNQDMNEPNQEAGNEQHLTNKSSSHFQEAQDLTQMNILSEQKPVQLQQQIVKDDQHTESDESVQNFQEQQCTVSDKEPQNPPQNNNNADYINYVYDKHSESNLNKQTSERPKDQLDDVKVPVEGNDKNFNSSNDEVRKNSSEKLALKVQQQPTLIKSENVRDGGFLLHQTQLESINIQETQCMNGSKQPVQDIYESEMMLQIQNDILNPQPSELGLFENYENNYISTKSINFDQQQILKIRQFQQEKSPLLKVKPKQFIAEPRPEEIKNTQTVQQQIEQNCLQSNDKLQEQGNVQQQNQSVKNIQNTGQKEENFRQSLFSTVQYAQIQPVLAQLLSELKELSKVTKQNDNSRNNRSENKVRTSSYHIRNTKIGSGSISKGNIASFFQDKNRSIRCQEERQEIPNDSNKINKSHYSVKEKLKKGIPLGLGGNLGVDDIDSTQLKHQKIQKIKQILSSNQQSSHQQNSQNQIKNFSKQQCLKQPQNKSKAELPIFRRKVIRDPKNIQRSFYQSRHKEQIKQFPESKATEKIKKLSYVLKIARNYLKMVASGKIDDIEACFEIKVDKLKGKLQRGSQNVLHRQLLKLQSQQKLLKNALYLERASVIGGVCYSYLTLTQLIHEMFPDKNMPVQFKRLKNSKSFNMSNTQQPKEKHFQQSASFYKQIIKYLINLASFCSNNSKLIFMLLQDFESELKEPLDLKYLKSTQVLTKQFNSITLKKQISRRTFQNIKLNVQYINETLNKLFSIILQCEKTILIRGTKYLEQVEQYADNFRSISRLVGKYSLQESLYTLLEYFAYFLAVTNQQNSIPFLSVVPNPYLEYSERYTLLIDFIEVFCYGTKKSKNYIFRPYSEHFLKQLAPYYDIIVFSNALPGQIDPVIDIIDKNKVFKQRLYKHHLVENKQFGTFVLDPSRLGLDLDKIIILGTEKESDENLEQQESITIEIPAWQGRKNDTKLAQLCSILAQISVQQLSTTKAVKKINRQFQQNKKNGIKFLNFGLDLKSQT